MEQKGVYQHVMRLVTLIFAGMQFSRVSVSIKHGTQKFPLADSKVGRVECKPKIGMQSVQVYSTVDLSFLHGYIKCRYVQAPLAYPRERKRRMNGGEDWLPFCIYSGGNFAEKLSPCYWSDYYSANPRNPDVTQLAPWVARFYSKV